MNKSQEDMQEAERCRRISVLLKSQIAVSELKIRDTRDNAIIKWRDDAADRLADLQEKVDLLKVELDMNDVDLFHNVIRGTLYCYDWETNSESVRLQSLERALELLEGGIIAPANAHIITLLVNPLTKK